MKKTILALAVLLLMPLGSYAGTITSFPLVATGLFDNSGDGFNTYAMRVTADTDWTNADLQINLTSGSIIHVPPPFLGSPNGVNGLGDTAGFAPTNVLGDLTGGFNGVAGFAGAHVESPTSFQSSWFTTETNDIGTFDIAIITLSQDANGQFLWRTIAGSEVEDGGFGGTGTCSYAIVDGAIVYDPTCIPEPGSLALISIGVVSLLGTRHR